MKTLGVCFGATTLQCVILQSDPEVRTVLSTRRIPHEGDPRGAFLTFLAETDLVDIDRIAVTGRHFRSQVALSSISEPEAVELAVREEFGQGPYPDVVVSAGGETQLVYRISTRGAVTGVHSGNKCASGTGEFFKQQIRRMGLELEEAVEMALEGTPHKIAGRCSVFCKSDCTHALNKGEPKQNVVAGLCRMMADKIDELVKDMPSDSLAVIGGGSRNAALMAALGERHARTVAPSYADTFEAFGAALWATENECVPLPGSASDIAAPATTSFGFHPRLSEAVDLVDFHDSKRGTPQSGDECIIGLDAGSTTTKAVLIRTRDDAILASCYLRTNGDPIRAARECYSAVRTQLGDVSVSVIGLGVTGSGRQITGLHGLTESVINEIIAHATAAAHFDADVDTIFEIGGQDAKYTYLSGGIPADYAMNEACSAGTGSFLEESAWESLGIPTEIIGDRALASKRPPNFTDQCAAFISSDIKRASQEGIESDDILAGLVYSICLNYVNRVKGARRIGRRIFMQGGVCYNRAVPVAMASLLKTRIVVPPDPGLMGAFGVALETKRRLENGEIERGSFDLDTLIKRTASREGSFTCAGGKEKCDRKCEISRIRIGGTIYPFGGICDRYYNQRLNKSIPTEEFDLVEVRRRIMFDDYGPSHVTRDPSLPERTETVGINLSFLTQSHYPLFSSFFVRLGFNVSIADEIDPVGYSRSEAAFCLPAHIAHGGFCRLLAMRCNYLFLPQIMQVPVPNVPTYSRLCPFVQGEPYYMKTTFRKEIAQSGSEILSPVLKMQHAYEGGEEEMVKTAVGMGVSEKSAREAFSYACEKQRAFERELLRVGRKALYNLDRTPDRFGIVLFGRPYNAFAKEANMGVPHKVASRGITIIPHDMVPAEEQPVDKKMFWAMGQKIMKAARVVKERKNLFGVYVTNFSCGPDSFLLGYFRDLMQNKPSLTLELDQHTADAGIDTRIEAALDIMRSYHAGGRAPEEEPLFTPARVITDRRPVVVSSTGERYALTDPQVEVILPSMGYYGTTALAAVLRGIGINARALPIADEDVLQQGRKNATCKECLPYLITTGSFLTYLQNRQSADKVTLCFLATGGGPCRLGQYCRAFDSIIRKHEIPNAAVFAMTDENGYGGMGTASLLKAYQGVVVSDVFGDIRSMLTVTAVDPQSALRELSECWNEVLDYFEGRLSVRFTCLLQWIARRLSRIPLNRKPEDVPVISLVGEIFVRRDEFARKNVVEYLENHGFMVRVAPIAEYMCYSNYVVNNGLGEQKFGFGEIMKMKLRGRVQEWWERRIKDMLAVSGVYKSEMIDVDTTISGVKHLLNENFRGECILTVGLAMREILEHSSGVVSIGPFGCMYSRMAEAMLNKEMTVEGKKRMPEKTGITDHFGDIDTLPFLSLESDGGAFPQLVEAKLEAFVLQARRVHAILRSRHGIKSPEIAKMSGRLLPLSLKKTRHPV